MISLAKGKAFTENHLVIFLASFFRPEVTENDLDVFKLFEIN